MSEPAAAGSSLRSLGVREHSNTDVRPPAARIACAVGSDSPSQLLRAAPGSNPLHPLVRSSGASGGLDLGMVDISSPEGSGAHEIGSTPEVAKPRA